MSYIPMLLVLVVGAMFLGYRAAVRKGAGRPTRTMAAVPLASIVAWFALSWVARKYAETDCWGWPAAEWWAHSGKWYVFATFMLFFLGFAFGFEDPHPRWRRVLLGSCAVLLVVWTTVWRTIPVYAFLPRSVKRDDADGTIRQTVEYTCGPVTLANLMEQYMGITNVTEREMSRLSGCTYEGTTLSGLIRAARRSGLRVVSCRTMTMSELEELGRPAIVSISTIPVVRHATLFVEFDGDNASFIDPGSAARFIMTRERFGRVWYGKTLVLDRPEPVEPKLPAD